MGLPYGSVSYARNSNVIDRTVQGFPEPSMFGENGDNELCAGQKVAPLNG
jgi:hypothetical protein